jgi:hypothetical protein
VTSEKLARIEKDLDKIEEVNQAVVKQNASAQEQADKISRMEKMLSRPISSKT